MTLNLKSLFAKLRLLNAVSHDGKAQAGAMVGKVLGERQDLRTKVKELSSIINTIVNEVNSLSVGRAESDCGEKLA